MSLIAFGHAPQLIDIDEARDHEAGREYSRSACDTERRCRPQMLVHAQ